MNRLDRATEEIRRVVLVHAAKQRSNWFLFRREDYERLIMALDEAIDVTQRARSFIKSDDPRIDETFSVALENIGGIMRGERTPNL